MRSSQVALKPETITVSRPSLTDGVRHGCSDFWVQSLVGRSRVQMHMRQNERVNIYSMTGFPFSWLGLGGAAGAARREPAFS